jgi:hypothetical protein
MDFDAAISAHTEWKTRLLKYLEKPDASLEPGTISRDNACTLGQWIHGPAARHRHLPEYRQLVADHATFHKEAARIVERVNRGEAVDTDILTHPDSAYVIASRNVVTAILAVKRKVGATTTPPAATLPTGLTPPGSPALMEAAPSFLKFSAASPALTHLVLENASKTADEIAIILKAYGDKPPTAALISTIRETLLISTSRMFMQLIEMPDAKVKTPGQE